MAATLVRLNKALLGGLACFAWMGAAMSQTPAELPADYDSVQMSGKLRNSGTSFSVYLKCIPVNQATKEAAASVKYLGTDGAVPNCVVDSMSLTLNGRPIQFPAKTYADLVDVTLPRGVYLTTRGNTVVLHVFGGDGAGAYKVRYLIERQRLAAREIEKLNEKGESQVIKQTF